MKVLDLQCSYSHVFEGWFASEGAFQDQLQRGLVDCPMCGDTQVYKMLSAPRLNLGASAPAGNETRQDVVSAPVVSPSADQMAMQAAWMQMAKHVLETTEDVGPRFAEEARRIHYGETPERGIRGQATRVETDALLDEGIGVLPLPLPKALKGPLQ
jgi:hypothetical protein